MTFFCPPFSFLSFLSIIDLSSPSAKKQQVFAAFFLAKKICPVVQSGRSSTPHDFRDAAHSHAHYFGGCFVTFLLAGGLDECVDALVETEWEGGDDGFIGVRGESASNVVKNLTVNQFKKRLADHGLEGSLLKLNLLTDALATALASDD